MDLVRPAVFARAAVFLLSLVFSAVTFGAESKQLEWSALVAESWEAPLILPAPGDDGHYPVDPKSLVHSHDGEKVHMTGYMMPVRFEQNVVSEFLFLPYLGHHVQGHAHYDANQMIYVKLKEPVIVLDPFAAWTVQGNLRVASVTTEDGHTGYTMEKSRADVYQPPITEDSAHGQNN